MTVDVWFRNPDNYIRECVELGATQLAWDRGYLYKKSIDPNRFADLYFSAETEYRMLAIGDQGSALLERDRDLANPVAVFPTWEYGEDEGDVLVEMLANPLGENEKACGDTAVPPDERPVLGQPHVVIITRPPVVSTGPGRKFVRFLRELQDEFPDATVHLHGLYSWRVMFGMGFKSVDVDPRSHAAKGKVILPNGKQLTYEKAAQVPQWVKVVGMMPVDLKVPRNRCMFNQRSAWWAAEHYEENFRFKIAGTHTVDPTSPSAVPATTGSPFSSSSPATVGDKLLCDLCSLQTTCKYVRAGGVCSIPGSEPAPLAHFFKSRDADSIIEGLGTLLAAETHRLERGLADEEMFGELHPEVTKIIHGLFDRGAKLAKLRNPALAAAGAPRFGFQVNFGNGASVSAATPASLTAGVVAELESRGVKREDITPEMILAALSPDPEPIDVASTAVRVGDGSDDGD